MWKYKVDRKGIGVYSIYNLSGFGIESLLNSLKKRSIEVIKVKKIDEYNTQIKVKYRDSKNLFAIIKELCYNIKVKKVKDCGIMYPALFLLHNLGLFIGGIFFIISVAFANDFIFNFEVYGSGSVLQKEINQCLLENGIALYSRFSDIDISRLEDKILASNKNLSFISCQKKGNTLLIRAELSKEKREPISIKKELISPYKGIIEELKVYRGKTTFSVGDSVNVGDIIVSGIDEFKEQQVEVGVIANVKIISEQSFVYISKNKGEEEKAELFAMESVLEGVIETFTVSEQVNGEYHYTVTLKIRRVILAG